MSADFVPSIKSILRTIDSAIDIAQRVAGSASLALADHGQLTAESARGLQSTLERSSRAVKDAYEQCYMLGGESFTKPLREDATLRSQLKDIRTGLVVQNARCNDFDEDELDLFDAVAFTEMQYEVQRCCEKCIAIFHALRDANFQAGGFSPVRATTNTRFTITERSPEDDVKVQYPLTPSETPPRSAPVKPKSPWAIDTVSAFDLGQPAFKPLPIPPRRQPSPELSPNSSPMQLEGQPGRWIPREIVQSQMHANNEFLERRRQSRIKFLNSISPALAPIDEPRPGETFSESVSREHPIFSTSPIDDRRSRTSSSGYEPLVRERRSNGQFSQAARSSRGSSIYNRHTPNRDSQEPTSPQATSPRSNFAAFSPIHEPPRELPRAHPNAGDIESGLEVVVTNVGYDTEKMISGEPYTRATPAASVRSVDHPMGHDASFYKYGGFCDGAKALMRGETGFKVIIKPSGHYSTNVSAKCISCAYEIGCNDIEKDKGLKREGIYRNSDIRWRQRFISKCHVKTATIEEPVYACMFCIEEGKTIEDHDATVFFSVGALFRHLAKHSRPLPNIAGIITLYGPQPQDVLDFDLHYTTLEPRIPEFGMANIASKVATRPSAHAIAIHRPKPISRTARDPDGNETLHFAAGAKIVGITFPERFGGQWLYGYHDGTRGCFPAEKVTFSMPSKEDVLMNPQSNLNAIAKWDFKPKDAKSGGWLKFSKGDKISCIGYAFQDQWCWSGQTSKGKWGIFPSSFAKDLNDTFGQMPAAPVKSTSWKSGGAIGSIMGIGRNASKNHQRNNSALSNGSMGETWRG